MQASIRIQGLEELQSQLKTLKGIPAEVLSRVIVKYALKIQADAKRKAPVDTGRLRADIITEFLGGRRLTAEVGPTSAAYAPPVEFGSRPHMPPVSALAGWASRHGMKPGTEWAIAKTIAKRGTPAKPFMQPAADKNLPAFAEEATRELVKALREAGK